ncbi:hypothetical protein CcCBS67573_g08591 [Chytriomyces confervae]|uniref:WLM domain-containing protein n=1 Tax=Chytriomyces confervae TaxID=246404 RepID=A0A507EIY5_9FUNG|nr:hypothetical protein CcCBS67573_g08591 [Chytriomyces confervae]
MASLTVAHRGTNHAISVNAETDTIASVKQALEALTGVPVANQKLLHKSIRPNTNLDASTLTQVFGQTLPTEKILMVGSLPSDVSVIQRKDAVLDIRKARERTPTQPHPESSIKRAYTFGTVQPLPQFPDANKAKTLLIRLREDIGVIEVMRKHQWFVGTLTELHPAEKEILGFNRNMGAEISLRIRTDDLAGFRHYRTVVSVLMHELVHMVHSDHDDKFHALNRVLNKEYDEFSVGRSIGTDGRVDGSQAFSVEGEEEEGSLARYGYQGGSFLLGGSGAQATDDAAKREAMLAAAENRRLKKWEQDLVDACDGSKHSGTDGTHEPQ